ncbi:MAG: ketosteroid isomerase-like protein [Glaciecola sp.]
MRNLIILLAITLVSCVTPTSDAHEAHQNYVDAINSHDVDRMLGMLTDDAVFLAPNTPPIIGK